MTEPTAYEPDPLALESEMPSSLMTVNLGPSHPAMHGTVRLVVTLDGETIVEAVPEIGFLHRGFSKSSENSTWTQVLPYTDRLNYVSPYLNNPLQPPEALGETPVHQRACPRFRARFEGHASLEQTSLCVPLEILF